MTGTYWTTVVVSGVLALGGCTHADEEAKTGQGGGQQGPNEGDCPSDSIALSDPVSLAYDAAPAPAPIRGALTPGLYSLKSWTAYGAAEGPEQVKRMTFRYDTDGTGVAHVAEADGLGEKASFKWDVADGYLMLEYRCPAQLEGKKEGRAYSAESSALSVFTDDGAVLTFVRQ